MTTHTLMDEAAWLRACAAAPEDDTPRLAWADWLEENGQGERAAFVRVQCELARAKPVYLQWADAVLRGTDDGTAPEEAYAVLTLRRRERELIDTHRLSWLPRPLMDIEAQFAGEVFTFARGLPHRVVVPTVAALVGGPCPHCNTLDYMPLEDGGGGRICSRCGSTGRTSGLAAAIGRLMGAWERCGRCKGEKEVAERMKGKDIGSGYDSVLVFKQCPDCKDHTGKSTGLTWVPGGVLGCVTRVGIADREPEPHTWAGGTNYSWYAEGFQDDRATIPEAVFDLLSGGLLGMTPSSRRAYDTPDLAREALGAGAGLFCRLAAPREEQV